MGPYFEALDVPPDQGFVLLEEVFHLEEQLAALEPNPWIETPFAPPPSAPDLTAGLAALGSVSETFQQEECVVTGFADITGRLEKLAIEVPSWAYGNSGTRFKVFGSPGTPRTVEEKIADAATVHRFTGLAPSVALMAAYLASGYQKQIETDRVGGAQAGWN